MQAYTKILLSTAAGIALCATAAAAADFNIPAGDLKTVLDIYAHQSGVPVLFSSDMVRGYRSKGVRGDFAPQEALSQILSGTGLATYRDPDGSLGISRQGSENQIGQDIGLKLAQAATPARAAVETVTVTSSKLGGADVQSIPIAITALSQEQLTATQTAGGPDLVKQVPNLTFTKTNFTGYSIQIRGIGTQAISVTTDPAVAVAFNDIPFIRNHFFEQEFYDLGQAEVLRGPQGTLYGRNATAGVVNLISAKPADQFEAMASADIGNYKNRRFEGMINLPLVDDRLDLRVAGEWTKRDGYTQNRLSGNQVDGRDLWSSRITVGFKPSEKIQTYLVWEHFQENDDRMRTSKQLCKTDPSPSEVGGVLIEDRGPTAYHPSVYLSQGCLPSSLYSTEAFEVPNGVSLAYYEPLEAKAVPIWAPAFGNFDPYASTTQSRNLRVIETQIDPRYRAKNDTIELNSDFKVSPSLTISSQTGYNQDSLWSTEDYNRFDTAEGAFEYVTPSAIPGPNVVTGNQLNNLHVVTADPSGRGRCIETFGECSGFSLLAPCSPSAETYSNTDGHQCLPNGIFCDPQLGCSDKLVAQDLSEERAWQFSQEFRLASNFRGPLNFSAGGNYLHYETEENYYVFINTLSLASYTWAKSTQGMSIQTEPWVPGVSDNSNCIQGGFVNANPQVPSSIIDENKQCIYIDPNPIGKLNNQGHNYFLSQNPYVLNSYAGFGEVYYAVTSELKLTGGLRWTDDEKHFSLIPSELLVHGYGYPITGIVDQDWKKLTGRAVIDWAPKLNFTDQTLVYASYAHGYKAGGANPPGARLLTFNAGETSNPIHPLTFKPEFVNAFELGTKNALLDGGVTLNGDVFFYDYAGYQISRIVDRTAINDNFDAKVKGAELEVSYEPVSGLKFHFGGGYEDTRVNNGQSSIDLIDRTDSANHPDWMVVKPFVGQASNCILPVYVVAALVAQNNSLQNQNSLGSACAFAYLDHADPVTQQTYQYGISNGLYPDEIPVASFSSETYTYTGFDPTTAPNNGEGFAKNLSGNELPNAPHFTTSLSVDWTVPVSEDWAATVHTDFYWQSQSWARVFNDKPYDKIHGYSNVNLALILTSAAGWQVMGYLKNVFDTTAITGDFLNSDDSGLTTNVFLTDPRLFGVRVTKNW